jgi:hypothetical protein
MACRRSGVRITLAPPNLSSTQVRGRFGSPNRRRRWASWVGSGTLAATALSCTRLLYPPSRVVARHRRRIRSCTRRLTPRLCLGHDRCHSRLCGVPLGFLALKERDVLRDGLPAERRDLVLTIFAARRITEVRELRGCWYRPGTHNRPACCVQPQSPRSSRTAQPGRRRHSAGHRQRRGRMMAAAAAGCDHESPPPRTAPQPFAGMAGLWLRRYRQPCRALISPVLPALGAGTGPCAGAPC